MPLDFPTCSLPRTLLHRIGYGPDPLAPPDWVRALPDGTFGGRFDDPRHPTIPAAQRYQVLYLATTPTGACGETIARWRPSLRTLAAAPGVAGRGSHGLVPRTWRDPRRLASARTLSALPIVDVEDPDTAQFCRAVLAPLADARGLSDIDISVVTGPQRRLTQALAAMIYEEGRPTSPAYGGLRYVSRLNRAWECWALFIDRCVVSPQRVSPIAADDPSLHDAAHILQLDIETDGGTIISP